MAVFTQKRHEVLNETGAFLFGFPGGACRGF